LGRFAVRREIPLALSDTADAPFGLIPPRDASPLILAAHKLVYGQAAPRQPHARLVGTMPAAATKPTNPSNYRPTRPERTE
jgi:hypothetical protein